MPLLKDIPILGALFRSTSKSNDRRELMVLIRPTVLPTPDVAAIVAREEKSRMPGLVAAERDANEAERKKLEKAQREASQELFRREGFADEEGKKK